MRFLVDQDVYAITVNWLRESGHDVVTAKEINMERASDEDLLRKAKESSRLFLTRDKDFGTLVFLKEELSSGVILLRMTPKAVEAVHRVLNRLLSYHKEEELIYLFCVVEPNRYRIRHLIS